MEEDGRCPECQVPTYITGEHLWLDSGAIVQRRDPGSRLVFIESDNLDPLFRGIGELIGKPIERIVIESARRATRTYMNRLFPEEIKARPEDSEISETALGPLIAATFQVSTLLGCGYPSLEGLRFKGDMDDYITVRVSDPYSAPLYFGNFAGTAEAVLNQPSGVTYQEITPTLFEGTVVRSEHPGELHERLRVQPYKYDPGHVELAKCPSCGGPQRLGSFRWDPEEGTIRAHYTGKRMAMLGPAMLEPVFNELADELGDTIPAVVVEAQRLFIKSLFYSMEEIRNTETAKTEFALRGLGGIRELHMDRHGARLELENAVLQLLVTGLTQALFELTYGMDSHVEWELASDGVLRVQVTPAS